MAWLRTVCNSTLLLNDLLCSPLSWFFNDAWNVQISSVSFIPALCTSFWIGHRCFYVIFMRLELSIQRERTFNALHMGAGQQMSLPVIHISCQNWNVSAIHHSSANKVWEMKSTQVFVKEDFSSAAGSCVHTLCATNCLFTPESLGVGTKVQMISTHWCKLESQQRQVPSGNVNN